MEKGFVKDGLFAPVTPGKQLSNSVLINGRKEANFDGESENSGFQFFVNNVNYNTQFNGDGLASSTPKMNNVNNYDTQFNGDGLASSTPEANNVNYNTQFNGDGLAASTPEKQQSSKKRLNKATDINTKTPQKPRRHRPKILDERKKMKVAKAQVPGFQPKTPLKRSTPKPHTKKSHVKKNSSKPVDSPDDFVQRHVPTQSCKRSLNSVFDREAEAENICDLSDHGDAQFLNLNREEEKRFAKQYQRRRKKRISINSLNVAKPVIGANADHVTPESNVSDADPQSSQGTAHSSQVACEMDHSPSEMKECETSLPSSSVVWRRKRTAGCTRRRIYASQPMKFKCSRSPLVNLLEHLTGKKPRPRGRPANKKKDTKRRQRKVKPSSEHRMLKMIQDHLPQDCLIALKGLLDFIGAKMGTLSINQENGQRSVESINQEYQEYDQLVVEDRSVDRINQENGQLVVAHPSVDALVVYQGKFDPRKKSKKSPAKIVLDKESERAWTMLMAKAGSTTFDEQDPDKEYWDRERKAMIERVESIVSILREFQGNRRFSKWKGSVLDSIIGAFLTQNVSDHLSSSAYMYLAAKHPLRDSKGSSRNHESKCDRPLLDLFPQEDGGAERFVHRSASQEIEQSPSTSENGSPESCVSSTSAASETEISVPLKGTPTKGKSAAKNKKEKDIDWDSLRRTYSTHRERNDENMDSMDYQSVKDAPVDDVAQSIKIRGMQNVLAGKIKRCLDRTVQLHGDMDLEWLRDVPPKDAKEYLLGIYGIGLKSVECIRLLTLHHIAFPVDVNVGRVAVRLGWVPLQPLPGGLQMHLLEEYPIIDTVQKYLYPRLCTLNHETLYELHYHLITFGKLFCTKQNPRCEGCPLKSQCKHYASLSASKRYALPAPEKKKDSTAKNGVGRTTDRNSHTEAEPVVELPASPEHQMEEIELEDIEDLCRDHNVALPDLNDYPADSDDDILSIRLDDEAYDDQHEAENSTQVGDMSQALAIPSGPSATQIPNFRDRLKSVHQVYVLPDSHPILVQLRVDVRDPDDPSPYLFAPWTIQEDGSATRSPFPRGSGSLEVCRDIVCCSTLSNNEEHDFSTTISGTLMIPIRTANKGRFPLNGTYFQVNEVFADVESTNVPIIVPKHWLYGLERRILYCGASVSSTFRDIPMDHMHYAFTQGFYCSRGFNRKTRYTTDLHQQFHIKTSMQVKKTKGKKSEGNGR
ncbi:hypothetical protein DCAR_0100336 [Daucus carota subsp. sativus]|uniref:Demeter RRM-fold domain-containing protein n=1 Tax=Daucus carota subsp. sativus TaxID=79200 RepID=A0AAF0W319_DAUCS|nr:hypothetical protein DCAR_0100336 [Daucus carota subsp. sativus]